MASISVSGEWCYQEYANVSTSCGGLDGGNYLVYDSVFIDEENFYDGDYLTKSTVALGNDAGMRIIYLIPPHANINKSLWNVKHETQTLSNNETLNISLDGITQGSNYISLAVHIYTSTPYIGYRDFLDLSTIYNADGYSNIYEEGIYWYLDSGNFDINFYDELNNSLIGKDITLDIIGSTFSNNYTISGGNINLNLSFSNYTFRYNADGYTSRTRIIEVLNTPNNITLYLANYSSSRDITLKVINEFENNVQGATIEVKKFDVATNSFITITSVLTNVNGEASVALIPETELYRYLIYYDGVLKWNRSATNGEPVYPEDNSYTFRIQEGEDIYELKDRLNDLAGVVTFYLDPLTNISGYYNFTFASPNIETVCLKITNLSSNPEDVLNDSCLTASSGNIQTYYSLNQTTTLQALGLLQYEGNRYIEDSETNRITISTDVNPFKDNMSYEGWIFGILGIILVVLSFTGYPELVVAGGGIMSSLLMYIDVIYLNPTYKMGAIVGTLFLTAIVIGLVYQGGKK
jgi:hypothetical protein